MSLSSPGGSQSTRLALFPTLLCLTLVAAACGSEPSTGPSPPPPNNALPVVTSIFVKGTLSREPSQYATLGETVNVTATVTDAETPVNQLTYEWSSNVGGTFGANAATTTTWTAPATLVGTTPVNATLTLTVTERVDATRNNRVTATTVVDLHNSPKEVGDLARQFLLDFSRQLPVDMVMRNFTTCPEAAQEREQVATSNEQFQIVDYRVDDAATTVSFTGTCPFRNVRGDACARVRVYWRSIEKRTGIVGASSGTDQVTALLENGVWKLCGSDYELDPTSTNTGLAALMSRPHYSR